MAAEIAFHNAENSPHTRFYVPSQRTRTLEIVAAAFRALRLDVEYIANANCALRRDIL